jgi:hypothetical protein
VSTLRGWGAEPLAAFPNRTRQTPCSPNSRAWGVGAEVDDVEHRNFGAAQPVAVGDFEQGRVAEQRHPALAADGPDPRDLVVGVVEQRLQLLDGERPPRWPAFRSPSHSSSICGRQCHGCASA